jgi:hypothetical protein
MILKQLLKRNINIANKTVLVDLPGWHQCNTCLKRKDCDSCIPSNNKAYILPLKHTTNNHNYCVNSYLWLEEEDFNSDLSKEDFSLIDENCEFCALERICGTYSNLECEFLKKIRGIGDCYAPGIYSLTKKAKEKLFEYYYGKSEEK